MRASELRDLATDWLREYAPNSLIVNELSVADWGGASIDVAAITETQVVGVEIKGEGDSPTRLDRQGLAYGMVAREMWLLPDASIASKCLERKPPGWGRLEIWDGACRPMNMATKLGEPIKTAHGQRWPNVRDDSRYDPDKAWPQQHLSPHVICGALWHDELTEIARRYNLVGRARVNVAPLIEKIVESLPVGIIHDEMIAALRQRKWRRPILDLRSPDTVSGCKQGALV
ncbi:MAG: hypothetical protein AAF968_21685 [Pseudomonadota bacterium]